MKNETKLKKIAESKYKKNRNIIKQTAYKFKMILIQIKKNNELLNLMDENTKTNLKKLEDIWIVDNVLEINIKTLINFKELHPPLNTFFNNTDELYKNGWLEYIKSGMELRLSIMEYSAFMFETGLYNKIV